MKRVLLLLFAFLIIVDCRPLLAQHDMHDPDQAVKGGGDFPEGWKVRPDRAGAALDQVKFEATEQGYHITLGPAALFYRPEDKAEGPYTLEATFVLEKPSAHPEAFGLFVGGRDLDQPSQDYLYFLIRQNGQYLLKHRAGKETHTLVSWTAHPAIKRPDERGKATNTLTIHSEEGRVAFLVNGKEVTALDRVPMLNTDGVYGYRINHNLDVTVSPLRLER